MLLDMTSFVPAPAGEVAYLIVGFVSQGNSPHWGDCLPTTTNRVVAMAVPATLGHGEEMPCAFLKGIEEAVVATNPNHSDWNLHWQDALLSLPAGTLVWWNFTGSESRWVELAEAISLCEQYYNNVTDFEE